MTFEIPTDWFWRRYRKLPRFLRRVIRATLLGLGIAAAEFAIFSVGALLIINQLFDVRTFFSFLGVELVAYLILRLLGVGKKSEAEERYRVMRAAAMQARLSTEFSHLTLHYYLIPEVTSPEGRSYVVNGMTHSAFWRPDYISDLTEQEVIHYTKYENKEKLQEFFKINEIKVFEKYPEDDDLSLRANRKALGL